MTYKNYTLKDREWIRTQYKESTIGDCPYKIIPQCCEYMSPIERNVWSDLKCNGIKMYPQYPVLNYFLDFADPINKIGIEVDGEEFHVDKEKDKIRQNKIEKQGWDIYRIKGFWTFNELDEDEFYEDEYDEKEKETEGEYKYRRIFKQILTLTK